MHDGLFATAEHAIGDVLPPTDHDHAGAWQSLASGEITIIATRASGPRRVFLASRAVPRIPLSGRERAIAERVGEGRGYKDIAYELDMSNASVWRGIHSAARKIGVDGRLELAILAAAFGPSARSRSARIVPIDAVHDALVASIDASPCWSLLSAAERDVATLALAGHPGAVIADLRGARSARTIANQLDRVFRKAGVSGRAELAARLLAG